MEAEAYRKLYPQEFLGRFLSEGLRPDGRGLSKARSVSVNTAAVSSSPGSALVKIGDTTVITALELTLLEEEERRAGRPGIECELVMDALGSSEESVAKGRQRNASVTQRIIRVVNQVVDVEGLKCTEGTGEDEGRKFWGIKLKSMCLALDGCLFDAVLISVLAALADLKIPKLQALRADNADVDRRLSDIQASGISFRSIPTCMTIAMHKNYLMVDPTAEEESIATAHVSIVFVGEEDDVVSLETSAAGQHIQMDAKLLGKCISLGIQAGAKRKQTITKHLSN